MKNAVQANTANEIKKPDDLLTVTPETHKIPIPPLNATSESIETEKVSALFRSWDLYQENAELQIDDGIHECLMNAKVEMETCLTGRDLIKQGIVDCREKNAEQSKPKTKSEIDEIKLNFQSIIQNSAKAIFSHHKKLLESAIVERSKKYKFLQYFEDFDRDKMKIKLGNGKIIDLNQAFLPTKEQSETKRDEVLENPTISSETGQSCTSQSGLQNINSIPDPLEFLLSVLKIHHSVIVTVSFQNLNFESQIKFNSVNEVRKLYEIEKSREWGNLRVEIETQNQNYKLSSSNSTTQSLDLSKDSSPNSDSTVDDRISYLVCHYAYTSFMTDFNVPSLLELLATIQAIKFFGNSQFEVVKSNDSFYFVYKNDILRIEIEDHKMELFFNERAVECLE